jgi:hypothetical protein
MRQLLVPTTDVNAVEIGAAVQVASGAVIVRSEHTVKRRAATTTTVPIRRGRER